MINKLDIIKNLRTKFAKLEFFSKVYYIKNDIIIYNDKDIRLNYNINLFGNIDYMVKKIIADVKNKIEEKYRVKNHMVSVIIPNYNNQLFLKNVISKILASTYKNIEIIIVDDKSTDNSVSIIQKFNNNKIKLFINDKNSGTYYSRNKGILMSKGKYILIVDGDDYIDSTYIENMVKGLKNIKKNYWGYGKLFERVYLNKNLDVINRRKTISYNILFKRRLFNYLGFFQNSRYGADTEYLYRSQKFKYPIKYDSLGSVQYHANSLKNKNLTQIINWNKRRNYLKNAQSNVDARNYIEMAYLD
jgi:glycosyltransferase involved in cell wall biosynthesis